MGKSRRWARSFEAADMFELFVVSAVTALLGIRLYLHLAGYPQVGGATLHVAHVLWGGLLMAVALVVALSFIGRAAERAAALIGGAGFGTFIDEVGKFVTKSNDYFFEPAVALMYAAFVLLVLGFRWMQRGAHYSSQEQLLNGLRELEEAALGDMDEVEKRRAEACLERSDPAHPLVRALQGALASLGPVPRGRPSLLARVIGAARHGYGRLTRRSGFELALILFFVAQLAVGLAYVLVFTLFYQLGWQDLVDARIGGRLARRVAGQGFGFAQIARLAAWCLSAVFIVLGVLRIQRSRIEAYEMFERAVLVSLLLFQVFSFYVNQFGALIGLALNLLMLAALRSMIEFERERTAGGEPAV